MTETPPDPVPTGPDSTGPDSTGPDSTGPVPSGPVPNGPVPTRQEFPADGARWPNRRSLLVVIGVPLLGAALLLAGTLAGLRRGPLPRAIRPEDRQVLVTASDVSPYVPDLLIRTDGESFERYRTRDGRHVLRYEYNHPDPARELVIVCQVIVTPDVESARAELADLDARLLREASCLPPGIAYDPVPIPGRDNARYGPLGRNGETVGYLTAGRLDNRVYALLVQGVPIDADQMVHELAMPLRHAMAGYQP